MSIIIGVDGDDRLDSSEQAPKYEFLQQAIDNAKQAADNVRESDGGITLEFLLGRTDEETAEDWRDQYYGNELEIDPDDYDSEEEFQDAYKEKESWIKGISDKVIALADEYGIDPVDYDDYEEFIEAVKNEMD